MDKSTWHFQNGILTIESVALADDPKKAILDHRLQIGDIFMVKGIKSDLIDQMENKYRIVLELHRM